MQWGKHVSILFDSLLLIVPMLALFIGSIVFKNAAVATMFLVPLTTLTVFSAGVEIEYDSNTSDVDLTGKNGLLYVFQSTELKRYLKNLQVAGAAGITGLKMDEDLHGVTLK